LTQITVRQNYENKIAELRKEIEEYEKILSEDNPDLEKPYGFDWDAV